MARHRKLTQKFAGFPMFKLATSGDTFPVTSPFTTMFTGLVSGLVSDELALDLQFATDKTLTARMGPTPAFTRGSSGTFVGSNGLVRYAPNNAALYSGQLVIGTGWYANAAQRVTSIVDGLGPDGNNAYEVAEIATSGIHVLFNTGGTGIVSATSVVNGTTYTGSIFFKKVVGSVDWIQLSFSPVGFGTVQYANFNISNGTIGNFSSSSPQIQDAGNGWYRCSISVAAISTTTTSNLSLAFTNNVDTTTRLPSYAGSTANKVLAAMCQFEAGSFATSYIPTTTAALQGPRFDHDPVSLACKGLLMEESRTNLVLQSENFGTTWLVNNASMTLNTVVAPDGSTTADRLNEDTANSNHQVIQSVGSLTAGQPYTISVFAKAATHTTFQITTSSAAFGNNLFANFILTGSGSVGASSGVTTRIENYPNGWYRCSITIASITGGTGGFVQIAGNNNNSSSPRLTPYIGTSAQVVHLWGCQLEAGAFATSYIPTITSSVIRSADVCSISGSDFSGFYNPLEGSFATSTIFNSPANLTKGEGVFDVNDTTVLNRTRFVRNATNGFLIYANTVAGTQDVAIFGSTAMAAGVVTKLAGCMKANDFTIYLNNVSQGVDTISVMQPAPTTLTIGDASSGNPTRALMNGTIGSLRYFRKRLPNAKLQALTV